MLVAEAEKQDHKWVDPDQDLVVIGEAVAEAQSAFDTFLSKGHDFDSMEMTELAMMQQALSILTDMSDELKKSLQKVLDRIRLGALPNKMQEEGMESFKLAGVGLVYTVSDMHVGLVKDPDGQEPAEAYEWLEDRGHGDLIKRTVHNASLKALVKSLIRDGVAIPDDLFQVTPFTRAQVRKGK